MVLYNESKHLICSNHKTLLNVFLLFVTIYENLLVDAALGKLMCDHTGQPEASLPQSWIHISERSTPSDRREQTVETAVRVVCLGLLQGLVNCRVKTIYETHSSVAFIIVILSSHLPKNNNYNKQPHVVYIKTGQALNIKYKKLTSFYHQTLLKIHIVF